MVNATCGIKMGDVTGFCEKDGQKSGKWVFWFGRYNPGKRVQSGKHRTGQGTGDRGRWQVSTSDRKAKFLFKTGMRRGDPSAWLRAKEYLS